MEPVNGNLPENNSAVSGAGEGTGQQKFGCIAWLGMLILLTAVLAVLFFLLVKPALEERGIDVNEHWQELRKRSGAAVEAFNKQAQDVSEKSSEQISETVDKVKKTAEKTGEVKDEIAEKVEPVKEKVEEKVESWY